MQTYATLKTLRALGHKVTLINLVHPKIRERRIRLAPDSLLSSVRTLQFHLFRFFYFGKQTKRMYSLDTRLIPKADYTIVGSDQVWNSDITTVIKDAYFLGFAKNTKRISYASSFGKYDWEEDEHYTKQVKDELSNFIAVSVRESSGSTICKNVFGVDAIQLLDPTLYWRDYSELVKSRKPIKEIFAFLLVNESEENRKICEYVAKMIGCPVFRPKILQRIFGKSPKSWLGRMHNSEYIITDSFHGLAFSLIFHKQFLILCADQNKFARLQSLLTLLGLEDRYIASYDDLIRRKAIVTKRINYETVDSILNKEREKTRTFLNHLNESIDKL